MVAKIFILAFLNVALAQELDQLDELIDHLSKNYGSKIGLLTPSNYASVKRILPDGVKPVYVEHEQDLTKMVLNGSIVAALVSGLPEKKYHDALHIFSSNLVTMHSFLMAPDLSTDYPHGNSENLSTYHLSLAINAAQSKMQLKGIDLQLAIKNAPKQLIQAHTCKEDDQTQFAVPNKREAVGLLRDILDSQEIRVLAQGPADWGINDGNYLLDPPVGFYPDFLEAVVDEFKNLSGPDKELYGQIKIRRIFSNKSPFPWYYLFNGTAHLTEPYFILDAPYAGSGKPCTRDDQCLETETGYEKCTGYCRHASRPRYIMLRSSCTSLGTDSKFYTKRNSRESGGSSNSGLVVLIVLLVVFVAGLAGLLKYQELLETFK
ncbi:hypothetical protein BpHYR1_046149 [Brachionus plicatilis]|uniref:Uncharacterized protein n=1 Tax=Brachionus plicatilis TaxID=10195 RepID=A0A3M7PKZ0_BRAPC|nr:hypothetical protein BpHYR1_046149 [Brachionus plicatilis]